MNFAPECSFAWDGASLANVLFALPLAILFTFVTLVLYRWSVGRAMSEAGRGVESVSDTAFILPPAQPLTITVTPQSELSTSLHPILDASLGGVYRVSLIYAIAGLVHAVLATLLLFYLNSVEFYLFRTLLVFIIFLWPVVAVLTMTLPITSLQKVLIIGIYFLVVISADYSADMFHMRLQPAFGELFVLWLTTMGPQTLVILLLSHRAWRPVGLIALFVSLVLAGSYLFGFQLLGCLILTLKSNMLASFVYYILAVVVILFTYVVWCFLRYLAGRYSRKKISDQMLVIDSWWLVVTAFQVLLEMGNSGTASFLMCISFLGYRLTLRVAGSALRMQSRDTESQGLLLLRVFGESSRMRKLTDQVAHIWRHNGPIHMIAGTDLATALLTPDELMAFWGGRLRQGFISSSSDLNARIDSLDVQRDPDGRYRINEFFCHDDTWRATVRSLAQKSDVVFMDLHRFGRDNRGCEFELGMLLSEVPLERILLLVDSTTQIDVLKEMLAEVWGRLPANSPNQSDDEPVLQLVKMEEKTTDWQPLLSRLYQAADYRAAG